MNNNILFLTNNAISYPLIEWLRERNNVAVHEEKISPQQLHDFNPDLVISYSYRHILKQEVLALKPGRFINLHISFLPYNRGADPNVWSILDDTPKGVTIHLIDEGLDTGSILLQKQVVFDEKKDTLNGTYHILQNMIQDLFIENWEGLRDGTLETKAQRGAGSYHHSREFAAIKQQLLGNQGWNVTIETLRMRYQALLSSGQ